MAYRLNSDNLLEYLKIRLNYSKYNLDFKKEEDFIAIILHNKKFYIKPDVSGNIIKFSLDKIVNLTLDASDTSSDIEGTFASFLENEIKNDSIFTKGNHLYRENIDKDVEKWKKILKRRPENGQKGVMSCEIINSDVSLKKLRKAIYGYQFKPLLHFLRTNR